MYCLVGPCHSDREVAGGLPPSGSGSGTSAGWAEFTVTLASWSCDLGLPGLACDKVGAPVAKGGLDIISGCG